MYQTLYFLVHAIIASDTEKNQPEHFEEIENARKSGSDSVENIFNISPILSNMMDPGISGQFGPPQNPYGLFRPYPPYGYEGPNLDHSRNSYENAQMLSLLQKLEKIEIGILKEVEELRKDRH